MHFFDFAGRGFPRLFRAALEIVHGLLVPISMALRFNVALDTGFPVFLPKYVTLIAVAAIVAL